MSFDSEALYLTSEVLGEGCDPDDLAAVVCAHLRHCGILPTVIMRVELGAITGIEIHVRGLCVATFGCRPMPFDGNKSAVEQVLKAIEGKRK